MVERKIFLTARILKEPVKFAQYIFGKLLDTNWISSIPQYFVQDLKIPPGNMLETLTGNREGQYSIRINDQYRICFKWKNNGAESVEIIDYHKG